MEQILSKPEQAPGLFDAAFTFCKSKIPLQSIQFDVFKSMARELDQPSQGDFS